MISMFKGVSYSQEMYFRTFEICILVSIPIINLKHVLSHGSVLKQVHRIINFNQKLSQNHIFI